MTSQAARPLGHVTLNCASMDRNLPHHQLQVTMLGAIERSFWKKSSVPPTTHQARIRAARVGLVIAYIPGLGMDLLLVNSAKLQGQDNGADDKQLTRLDQQTSTLYNSVGTPHYGTPR